jgi:hypothetical protein
MTQESAALLERLLRDNNLGWIIDMDAPRNPVPLLLERLKRVESAFSKRFRISASCGPENLADNASDRPHEVRAFLQALATGVSVEMLVMVWQVLRGRRIYEVTMNYREEESFHLVVTLAQPADGQEDVEVPSPLQQDDPLRLNQPVASRDSLEVYQSTDINDAALVRHFGITTVNDRPLFDGFFPAKDR